MAKGKKTGGRDFTPGRSPNPGGRPKALIAVQEAARARTEESLAVLVELLHHGKPDLVRLRAAEALLERAWGKPTQPLEGADPDRPMKINLVWEDVGVNSDTSS